MPHTGPVEDRLAIRELLDSYGDAVCRHDADAWEANWAPDGLWSIRGNEVQGREAIRAYWVKAMAAYRFISFSSYPGDIQVDGDTAQVRVQTTEFLTPVEGRPRRQHGTYQDRLVKVDGRWRFAHRSFNVNELQEL